MAKRALRHLLIVLVALGFAGLAVVLTSADAVVDDALASLVRAEHHLRYRLGWPLRGQPEFARLDERLAAAGHALGRPVLVRVFKQESELEVWLQKDGRFTLFATYPICRWSGELGPKQRRGDRQSPEGFYTVSARQLNPASRWHRAFNIGYPNAFDRAHHRTGDFIMVHGGCSSIGCFAITNEAVSEVWRLVTAALEAGQPRFQVQVFPFRMTDRNFRIHAGNPWAPFWRDLKAGYDQFERDGLPPRVSVCRGRYAVAAGVPGSLGDAPIAARCPAATTASGA
jgi:murein L,D-transpeptidase YafK